MMRLRLGATVLWLASGILLAAPASAATVTWSFTGVVRDLYYNGPNVYPDGSPVVVPPAIGVAAGDTLSGFITFDTSVANSSAYIQEGVYTSIESWGVTIGGWSPGRSAGAPLGPGTWVVYLPYWTSTGATELDAVDRGTDPTGALPDPLTFALQMSGDSLSKTSEAMPVGPPSLASLAPYSPPIPFNPLSSHLIVSLNISQGFDPNSMDDGTSIQLWSELTSLTEVGAVPEPGELAWFVLAVAALAARRRR